jgi:hypothetical protein
MSQVSEMSPREEAIMELVTTTPGIIKDEVVKRMDGQSSRVTTYKILSGLIEGGILLEKKDKPNSQTHHLFINNDNLYVTINGEIKQLKMLIQSMHTPIKEITDILKKEFGYGSREFKISISNILHYRSTIELMIYRLIRFTYKVNSDSLSHKLREDILIVFSELADQIYPTIDYLGDYELSALKEELESIEKGNKKFKEEFEYMENKKELWIKKVKDAPQGRVILPGYKNRLRSGIVREHFYTLTYEMNQSIINYRNDFKQKFEQKTPE